MHEIGIYVCMVLISLIAIYYFKQLYYDVDGDDHDTHDFKYANLIIKI